MLLGWIVEDLRRKSFDEALHDGITGRLGLKHTRAADSVMPSRNEVLSFKYAKDQWAAEREWHGTFTGAAGNMVSTPSELLRFAHALYTGRLLKPATVARMQQVKGQLLGSRMNGYGLGMFSIPFKGRTAWGHNGGVAAFHSTMGYFPADSVGVAILLNGERYPLNEITISVLSAVYDEPYPIPDFNRAPVVVPDTVLQRYAGTYFSKDFPLKIFIRAEGDKLIARATGQGAFELKALSENEFFFVDANINLRFAKSPDGAWIVMYFDQRGHKVTFTKEVE
jgi:CubicO group peptidase (beta-lactamase class C family)